jgi:hypothetical protein
MKHCSNKNCEKTNPQPFSDFAKDKKRKDKVTAYCKSCLKRYRDENKVSRNITIQKWRKNNPEKMREYRKANAPSNLIRSQRWRDKFRLQKLYGISNEVYSSMYSNQNGCCAICKKHESSFKKKLHVDHDHSSGAVRGLLCHRCNMGIGMFWDKKEVLLEAYNYLKGNT